MVYKPSFVSGSVNENCFLIRIPSMQVKDGTRKFIAKAVRQYKRSDCLYLILDLRGNGGGADGVYYPLVELAYDHPGRKAGAYFRNTDSNRAFFMEGMKRNRVMMKTLRACADKPDSLVCLVDAGTLTLDKVHKDPRRIAVIIDNHVASNAENLLLELQSVSERIVLYGRDSTLGCVDYVNPRPYAIPSRDMVVYIPTTRSGRLPEHPVDPAGIAPEVIIPLPLPEALTDNIDTWTRWVAEDLVKRESGGQ
jgi:C-terminal processing protease CtpA/Prc